MAHGSSRPEGDDHRFAPVVREPEEEPGEELASDRARAGGRPVSGTGVVGAAADHPDTLPPTPEGVAEAERTDDTGDQGWIARAGRPRDPSRGGGATQGRAGDDDHR